MAVVVKGVVKAAQVIVSSVIDTGKYAQSIAFFGVERKGSPVFGFLRIDDKDIRIKTQVYTPKVLAVFDDTLLSMEKTF
ncbi:MAG: 2-oxoacid:acceptor oxidoreductase family protein [Intestinibacter bartlettii]